MILIFGCSYAFLIKGQKSVSSSENRTLEQYPIFTLINFYKGEFQSNLENAISDQFFHSENIKSKTLSLSNNIYSVELNFLIDTNLVNLEGYTKYSANFYIYNENYHLLMIGMNIDDYISYLDINAKQYNEDITGVKKYYYFVENDKSMNFTEDTSKENKFYSYIKQIYEADGFSNLDVNSFEDFDNYFYKTDHHWNYKGSYEGYCNIINMIFGEDEELIKPADEVTFDCYFFGSRARKDAMYTIKEKFTVYTYDTPEHIEYVNGIQKEYGSKSKYLLGEYSNSRTTNHYGVYYGSDYAEVIYDYNNPNKDNLLIIASSYSNAINELVASHFNKTYVIDLRHYDNFDVKKYIKENDIDVFLFIGDACAYIDENFRLEGE